MRKKNTFNQTKMLSSRVELSDYIKFEQKLNLQNLSLQEFVNHVVVNFISGNLQVTGSL